MNVQREPQQMFGGLQRRAGLSVPFSERHPNPKSSRSKIELPGAICLLKEDTVFLDTACSGHLYRTARRTWDWQWMQASFNPQGL